MRLIRAPIRSTWPPRGGTTRKEELISRGIETLDVNFCGSERARGLVRRKLKKNQLRGLYYNVVYMLCFCDSLAPKVTMAPRILFPFAQCLILHRLWVSIVPLTMWKYANAIPICYRSQLRPTN